MLVASVRLLTRSLPAFKHGAANHACGQDIPGPDRPHGCAPAPGLAQSGKLRALKPGRARNPQPAGDALVTTMNAAEIKAIIESGLPNATVTVSGDDGQHFEAEVVSPEFEGLSMVKQHQRVYSALGNRMGVEIHALALRTRAS